MVRDDPGVRYKLAGTLAGTACCTNDQENLLTDSDQ
jgi:hypothetical protein